MGIPTDFSNASLSRFEVSSPRLVKIEQEYKGARGKKFFPCNNGNFVRVDDPRAIDSNGVRRSDVLGDAQSLEDEMNWLPHVHPDGTLTYGGNSAWLECRDVHIPKDKRLWFRYAFLRFSSLPCDAFAVLLCFPNNATGIKPLPPYWISSVKDLTNANQTDWIECFVEVDNQNDFNGTLRWVVSTGHNVVDRNAIPDNTRFARPGCLLIDAIDIR